MREHTQHTPPSVTLAHRPIGTTLRRWGALLRVGMAKALLGPLFQIAYRLGGPRFLQGLFFVVPSQWIVFFATRIGWSVPEETLFSGHLQLVHLGEAGLKHLRIGPSCYFGPDVLLDLSDVISLGSHVSLSPRVTILTHADPGTGGYLEQHFYPSMTAPVHIEDDVWVGAGAVLLPGVRIGTGSVVAAGAVVTRDVAPQTVVAGVPARVVKQLTPPPRARPASPEG